MGFEPTNGGFADLCQAFPDIQLRNVRTPDINKLFKALIAADGDEVREFARRRIVGVPKAGVQRAQAGVDAQHFDEALKAKS